MHQKKFQGDYMLKIGFMDYANVYPIFHYIQNMEGVDFLKSYPSNLNIAIRDKIIDISPSSSIEFIRNYEQYNIIPLSISSTGKVKSVFIISDLPVKELDGKKVYFSKESNTSTILSRIVLEKFYNINPVYTVDRDDTDISAELIIGDSALKEYYSSSATSKNIIDLGEEWYKATSLPFVFGLWIMNKDVIGNPNLDNFIKTIIEISKKDKTENLKFINKYIDFGITKEQMLQYWDTIDYSFTDDHIKGLELFYKYAFELDETCGNNLVDIKPFIYKHK